MFVPGHFRCPARITNVAADDDAILEIDAETASDKQRSAAREDKLYKSDPTNDDFGITGGLSYCTPSILSIWVQSFHTLCQIIPTPPRQRQQPNCPRGPQPGEG